MEGRSMTAALVKGTILGGLVLFLWGAVSWMAIGWHDATLLSFSNEDAVTQAIAAGASRSGVYLLPNAHGGNEQAAQEKIQKGPTLAYGGRVLFLVGVALTVGVVGHLPEWNWWSFSASYTLLDFADLIIGWGLAGLVIAKVVR